MNRTLDLSKKINQTWVLSFCEHIPCPSRRVGCRNTDMIYDIWSNYKLKMPSIRPSTSWMSQLLLWPCLLYVTIRSWRWAAACCPHKQWYRPVPSQHASSQISSNTANGSHKAAPLRAMSPPPNPNFSWLACRAAELQLALWLCTAACAVIRPTTAPLCSHLTASFLLHSLHSHFLSRFHLHMLIVLSVTAGCTWLHI